MALHIGTAAAEGAAALNVLETHLLGLLERTNTARLESGTNVLRIERRLTSAALDHARFLAEGGFLSHGGRHDSTPASRAEAVGYNWSRVGENVLARTTADADEAYLQWWNSEGHRINLLEPAFIDCGLARAYGARVDCWYYVMLLAAPA